MSRLPGLSGLSISTGVPVSRKSYGNHKKSDVTDDVVEITRYDVGHSGRAVSPGGDTPSAPVCLKRFRGSMARVVVVVTAFLSVQPSWSKQQLKRTGWADAAPRSDYDKSGLLIKQQKRHAVVTAMAETPGPLRTGDVYNFGVYTGGGLRALVTAFNAQRNITFSQIWGFDSFTGLPESNVKLHSPSIDKRRHGRWQAGDLNAAEQLESVLGSDAYNIDALITHITKQIGTERATMIPGFFNESLPSLSPDLKRRMQPAILVDVDCDIYEGTIQGLEFLIVNRLMIRGSHVYYDDWQKENEGEVKAHAELTAKHRLVWKDMLLPQACRREGGGCERQRLFRLESVGFRAA